MPDQFVPLAMQLKLVCKVTLRVEVADHRIKPHILT